MCGLVYALLLSVEWLLDVRGACLPTVSARPQRRAGFQRKKSYSIGQTEVPHAIIVYSHCKCVAWCTCCYSVLSGC